MLLFHKQMIDIVAKLEFTTNKFYFAFDLIMKNAAVP